MRNAERPGPPVLQDGLDDKALRTPFYIQDYRERLQCPHQEEQAASNSSFDGDELRVMTWNVEWAFATSGARVDWIKDVVEKAGSTVAKRCPQNLFDRSLIERPFRKGHPCYSASTMTHHLQHVAKFLKSVEKTPHIVNLVEVDSCDAVRAIGQDLPAHKPYLVYGSDDRTTEQVGLLSSLPMAQDLQRFDDSELTPVPGNEHCDKTMGQRGLSKHYVAKFEVRGRTVYVIGLHLKSMRQEEEGDACSIREAEAKIIDKVLARLHAKDPSAEFIVLGDFNDFDPDVPGRRQHFFGKRIELGSYTGCDGEGEQAEIQDEGFLGQRSRVFRLIKGDGANSSRPQLVNLMSRVEQPRRYTHMSSHHTPYASMCGASFWPSGCKLRHHRSQMLADNEYDVRDCGSDGLIDHVLVSPGLAAVVKEVNILNEADFAQVYSSEEAVMKTSKNGRWKHFDGRKVDKLRKHRDRDPNAEGFNPSDHLPVMVTFDLSSFPAPR